VSLKDCFSPFLYRNRNAIERLFCRLKDFRRVAIRYDRNAANSLVAVCIAAADSYWLWVWTLGKDRRHFDHASRPHSQPASIGRTPCSRIFSSVIAGPV
jgi:hypothetical protein